MPLIHIGGGKMFLGVLLVVFGYPWLDIYGEPSI